MTQLIFALVLVIIVLGGLSALVAALQKGRPARYHRGNPLLSRAEWTFFNALRQAVPDSVYIAPKVRIADILEASGPPGGARRGAFSRIAQKHVDFALCDLQSFEVFCVVELDDSSHNTAKGRRRDELVNRAFESARVPILRIPCRPPYSLGVLAELVESALRPVRVTRRGFSRRLA